MRSTPNSTRAARFDIDARDTRNMRQELAELWPLLGRHIAFHRRLVDVTGNVKAALFLSQVLYWTQRGRDVAERGGWFYKTADQWDRETGLSAKEQAHARERLRQIAVIEEQRAGLPARLHFRLDREKLAVLLSEVLAPGSGGWDWRDHAALLRVLGPAHAYHRVLTDVAGGVLPALLLSRALALSRVQRDRAADAWFSRPVAAWFEDLGLSRREQESARHDLVALAVWEERRAGIPPVSQVRIRLDVLRQRLEGLLCGGRSDGEPRGMPDCGMTSINEARFVESSLRESRNLVSTKPPPQIRPNRPHGFDQTAIPYMEVITRCELQTPRPHRSDFEDARAGDTEGRGGGDLIFPTGLKPEERTVAAALASRCPDHAQALLDELAARMQARAVTASPLAYLRGLVTRALAGSFIPEAGLRIAAARRRWTEPDPVIANSAPAPGLDEADVRRRLDAHRAALRDALRTAQAKGRKP